MRLSLPKIEVLAAVSRAIFRGLAIRVTYTSNTSGAGERELVPFALVPAAPLECRLLT
jgi:predicted DNA-binding transcriptional regulator YafY